MNAMVELKMLTGKEVADKIGVKSTSSVYRYIDTKGLPKPVNGKWHKADIDAWIVKNYGQPECLSESQ